MDLGTDVWNQVAIEAAQLYFEDEFGNKKSRFADTVCVYCLCSVSLLNVFPITQVLLCFFVENFIIFE